MASVRHSSPEAHPARHVVTWAAVVVTVVLGSTACTPSCESVCRKAISCSTADALNQLECEESCNRTITRYEVDGDRTLVRRFADHRRCLGSASCDEIDAGVCYDEALYSF